MVRWLRIVFSLVLQTFGYLIFLKGFFPPKVVLDGVNTHLNGFSLFEVEGSALFDKLIVMVVDAMRSDFMYSSSASNMPFLHSIIESGNAIPFTAYSNPPTVTLPRLKGITTGGTPSFIDAILNVADDKDDSQSLAHTDSWIRQFKNMEGGRVIHFYGDDTWLKLFPPEEFFEKYEGTGSFFVSDFTEVDNNVTRHLDGELKDNSWDALVLHYLGMDHIGHKGGPNSPFMKPKQGEMDEIVKRIYSTNVNSSCSTLMVLMGDHGMNEAGNHGGSSRGETSPGMVLISPKFNQLSNNIACPADAKEDFDYYSHISQIDLVPTLAALFNFPIPKNNLGVVIPEVLGLWGSYESKKKVLLENCEQFMGLLNVSYSPEDHDFVLIREEFQSIKHKVHDLDMIINFLRKVQSLLTESATNYLYPEIWTGFGLIILAFIMVAIEIITYFLKETQVTLMECSFFVCICVLYSLHFHGSSFIEEEHQIWWFFTVVTLVSTFIQQRSNGIVWALACISCLRVIKGWNDSGQKYTSALTISSFLLHSPHLLWMMVILTYLTIAWLLYSEGTLIELFSLPGIPIRRLKSDDISSLISFVISFVVSSLSFLFKLSQHYVDGNLIPKWLNFFLSFVFESFGENMLNEKSVLMNMNVRISRLFTNSFIILLCYRILVGKLRSLNSFIITDMLNLLTLFLLHQSRLEVIPIFLVFTALRLAYRKLLKSSEHNNANLSLLVITSFILCVQNLSFFSVGNTNLLATIDLSNAYNGVATYEVYLVGLLTFISNFAVPLFWSFAGLQLMFEDGSSAPFFLTRLCQSLTVSYQRVILIKAMYLLFFYCLSMINLVASSINLRYHLFIWSVFCPKLLYFSSWTLLLNFIVDFVLAIMIVTFK